MSKMGSHDTFGHFKHKLWPKERSGVKLSIWLLTTKNQESPRFLMFRKRATYHCKSLNEGYNFAFDLISIRGLHTKLWAPKVAWVPTLGTSGLGSPETKWHLGVDLVARRKVYYKGEGGGFLQVWVVVSFMNLCLPMAHPCTKVFQLWPNQLIVWFVQVHVSNWIDCQSS